MCTSLAVKQKLHTESGKFSIDAQNNTLYSLLHHQETNAFIGLEKAERKLASVRINLPYHGEVIIKD
jgi:hypothetical protein